MLNFHSPPPDPWTYIGPTGRYKFFNYHGHRIRLSWLATFLVTCMGDVYDATATQGFRPDEPYPDGVYECQLDYTFPSGSSAVFALEMTKVEAPDWYMTFSDIVNDLEALWYAALWFEGPAGGFPEIDFEVFKFERQSSGSRGVAFLASRGSFGVALTVPANVTEARSQCVFEDGSTKKLGRYAEKSRLVLVQVGSHSQRQ